MTSVESVIAPALILSQHLCLLCSSLNSLFLSRWICNLQQNKTNYCRLLHYESIVLLKRAGTKYCELNSFRSSNKMCLWWIDNSRLLSVYTYTLFSHYYRTYARTALMFFIVFPKIPDFSHLQGDDHTLSETLMSPNTPSPMLGTLSSIIVIILRTKTSTVKFLRAAQTDCHATWWNCMHILSKLL